MKDINILKLIAGYFISYSIVFLVGMLQELLAKNVIINKEFIFNFPLLLTIYPIKVLKHYPGVIFFVIIFFVIIIVLQKNILILKKLPFIVLMFIAWDLFGLLVMVKQAIDF